jgi:thiol-disulfide isomerase/thioredoxin
MKSCSSIARIKTTAYIGTILLSVMLTTAFPCHANSSPASGKNPEALKDILGNWVDMENGFWNYGFYPTYAVMDGAFWNYENITTKKGKLQIQLRQGKKVMTVYAQPAKGLLKAGTDEKHLTAYARQAPANPDFKNYEQTGFKLPLVQRDSFKLSGIIGDYNPENDKFKYIQVIYNSIIEEDQLNFPAQLDSLGRFSITFPLLNPQDVMLRVGNGLFIIFASPGSNAMVYMMKGRFDNLKSMEDFAAYLKIKPDLLFMGNEGLLNTEINEYWTRRHGIFSPVESQQMTDSLDMPTYKAKRLGKMNDLLTDLDKYAQAHHSSKKFVEQETASIRYSAIDDLMRYRWLRRVELNADYLSFLNTLSLNDDLAVSTTSYFSVIREYSSFKKAQKEKSLNTQTFNITEILNKVIETKDISADDKRTLQRLGDLQQHLNEPETQKVLKKDSAIFQAAFAKHNRLIQETAQAMADARRNNATASLQQHLIDSLPACIGRDIMLAKMASEQVKDQKVLTPAQLSTYKAAIQTAVFYDEIVRANTELSNKLNGKGPMNTELLSPVTASAKNVLESLVSKYKGNVVYVDFWAPWCGPCMGEMPEAKTLKKELAGKNVTFLYLCVNCTEESWTKTIKAKEIEGQHYRLNDDEYVLLSSLFKITGIPRYLLIDKEGAVVDQDANRPSDGGALVKKIEALLH